MREELEQIEKAAQTIKSIPWGYDGDCGAYDEADNILAAIQKIKAMRVPSEQPQEPSIPVSEQSLSVTQYLIDHLGFEAYRPIGELRNYGEENNKWSACKRIHELHWLAYSEVFGYFSIIVRPNFNAKGLAGGGAHQYTAVMIPRLCRTIEQAKSMVAAMDPTISTPSPSIPVSVVEKMLEEAMVVARNMGQLVLEEEEARIMAQEDFEKIAREHLSKYGVTL